MDTLTINDKALHPYHIEVDKYQFTVVTKEFSDGGKEYTRAHCHTTKLSAALQYIAKRKLLSAHSGEQLKMDEFVAAYDKCSRHIVAAVKENPKESHG